MNDENMDNPARILLPTHSYSGSYAWGTRFDDMEPDPRDWLAAIIDGSDDAIISKDLNGSIKTWNRGAQRLFGYEPAEIIGKPINILIPDDRLQEEPAILAQIRAGNRVDHFETVRKKKDGTLVDISLTISPIRASGQIMGASKIARDITERRRAQEQQHLLMGEMNHRIKNLFALANAIVSLSGREAKTTEELRQRLQARLSSLARAHALTMPSSEEVEGAEISLHALLQTILEPYDHQNITVTGADPAVSGKQLSSLSLLLHEFATNAAKHGALSTPSGSLCVTVLETADTYTLLWSETVRTEQKETDSEGFGTRLESALITALNASVQRNWLANGLEISVLVPKKT
ncbi:histidine kinase [Ochrobactrum sp. POC9]|uniref:PAS domain S-box protein n=1 Tax=Ochrobactrum sp. POC9 TaxID=2203419 RepID=UPI000D705AA7|nr:PAS domain S-box protein [Ochrobactrum sp. POC9]PWU72375.1 histidine kinase [Ochrobactrum sp. POC9]